MNNLAPITLLFTALTLIFLAHEVLPKPANVFEPEQSTHLDSDHGENKRSPSLKGFIPEMKDFMEELKDKVLSRHKREDNSTLDNVLGALIPQYCKALGGQCGDFPPWWQVICLQHCVTAPNPLQRKYANFVPKVIQFLCTYVIPEFQKIPGLLKHPMWKFPLSMSQLIGGLIQVKNNLSNEIADLIKAIANALLVTYIKLNENPEDSSYYLKPLIMKLELQGTSSKHNLPKPKGDDLIVNDVEEPGIYENKNCPTANLNGEAVVLSEIVKKRACLLDILMPGYFFFNRAPGFMAKRPRVTSTLKGFRNLLFTFTGAPCCLIPYKHEGKVYKCGGYNITTPNSGPEFNDAIIPPVCGAVPSYDASFVFPGEGRGDDKNVTNPDDEAQETTTKCNPNDDLYTNEDEESCNSAPDSSPPDGEGGDNGAGKSDYVADFSVEADNSLGSRAEAIEGVGGGSAVDAAYGEGAPDDNEFFAEREV